MKRRKLLKEIEINLRKLFKRKKTFPEKRVALNNRDFEWVFLNKKQKHIATTQLKDKRIYVNKSFFDKERAKEKQKTIIYHERGHSHFLLWRPLSYLAIIFKFIFLVFLIFSLFTFVYIGILYLLGVVYQSFFININYIFYGLTLLSLSIINLLVITVISWMLEVIADFNAVKNMGKENFNDSVIHYYKEEKEFNLWNDWIIHPPWKLRKRIMDELD